VPGATGVARHSAEVVGARQPSFTQLGQAADDPFPGSPQHARSGGWSHPAGDADLAPASVTGNEPMPGDMRMQSAYEQQKIDHFSAGGGAAAAPHQRQKHFYASAVQAAQEEQPRGGEVPARGGAPGGGGEASATMFSQHGERAAGMSPAGDEGRDARNRHSDPPAPLQGPGGEAPTQGGAQDARPAHGGPLPPQEKDQAVDYNGASPPTKTTTLGAHENDNVGSRPHSGRQDYHPAATLSVPDTHQREHRKQATMSARLLSSTGFASAPRNARSGREKRTTAATRGRPRARTISPERQSPRLGDVGHARPTPIPTRSDLAVDTGLAIPDDSSVGAHDLKLERVGHAGQDGGNLERESARARAEGLYTPDGVSVLSGRTSSGTPSLLEKMCLQGKG
jgi:hypothetical protein